MTFEQCSTNIFGRIDLFHSWTICNFKYNVFHIQIEVQYFGMNFKFTSTEKSSEEKISISLIFEKPKTNKNFNL